jgi:uncharacterized protein
MEFEYDPQKSAINQEKHGIDFEAAKALWSDPDLLEVPAKTVDEERFLIVGKIGEKHWAAVITFRIGIVRIISVRRAREEEILLYES